MGRFFTDCRDDRGGTVDFAPKRAVTPGDAPNFFGQGARPNRPMLGLGCLHSRGPSNTKTASLSSTPVKPGICFLNMDAHSILFCAGSFSSG